MDEVGQRIWIQAKALLRDHGNETGAGLEVRIVELPVTLIAFEVGSVGGREKRTLVMVEPPSNFGRTGILEINDSVFVAVEMGFVKKRSRAVQQAGEEEVGVFANALAIEAGEECGGASSIETLVVVENSYFQ